jgi:ABC-2 type transport system permease protein
MRSAELAKRNLKEMLRDPMTLGVTLALPLALMFVLEALSSPDAPQLSATSLAPGITLFGFVMTMFTSAMILSRDRDSALLDRLLTTPLNSRDFVAAYSVPYLPIAAIQTVVIFAVGALLGLDIDGSVLLVVVVLAAMAVFYVGLGMILGSMLSVTPLSGAYTAVLLLTIFGGAWFELDDIGGPVRTVGNLLPFAHAMEATREVMRDGAGLGDIGTHLVWVLAYTVAVLPIAVVVFRRQMQE